MRTPFTQRTGAPEGLGQPRPPRHSLFIFSSPGAERRLRCCVSAPGKPAGPPLPTPRLGLAPRPRGPGPAPPEATPPALSPAEAVSRLKRLRRKVRSGFEGPGVAAGRPGWGGPSAAPLAGRASSGDPRGRWLRPKKGAAGCRHPCPRSTAPPDLLEGSRGTRCGPTPPPVRRRVPAQAEVTYGPGSPAGGSVGPERARPGRCHPWAPPQRRPKPSARSGAGPAERPVVTLETADSGRCSAPGSHTRDPREQPGWGS